MYFFSDHSILWFFSVLNNTFRVHFLWSLIFHTPSSALILNYYRSFAEVTSLNTLQSKPKSYSHLSNPFAFLSKFCGRQSNYLDISTFTHHACSPSLNSDLLKSSDPTSCSWLTEWLLRFNVSSPFQPKP